MSRHEFDDPIERLFYEQLVWKIEPEFVAAADAAGVSNEDLERAIAEMDDKGGLGQTFANLCRHVLTIRSMTQACAFMRPGEGPVTFDELRRRMETNKADA